MKHAKFKTAGIIALLYVISSFVWEPNMIVTVIVVPYLLLNLRALLIKKTHYKKSVTAIICYISLFSILGPFLRIIPYYPIAFIALGAGFRFYLFECLSVSSMECI